MTGLPIHSVPKAIEQFNECLTEELLEVMLSRKITLGPTEPSAVHRQKTGNWEKEINIQKQGGYGSSPPRSAIPLRNKKESIWIKRGQILLRSENRARNKSTKGL